METPEGEVYERRYWTNGTDSMAALYDGDGNRVFRMEYGGRTGGGSVSGAEKEETSESITQETGGEAGRSGSPLIPHAWETEEEQEEVTETRNNIFWYGFGQGLIQGLTTVPGYLSRWLHEHWEYILRRIDVHKDYEVHTFTEGGDEARKPKEGDTWTAALYDEIFIPYQVGEAARENYVETSYVNDVNRAYAETLMEYQADGSAASIYEYGIQRLSYTDTGSQELFTYLYDGRGSVSNLTSQSGASVLSYVYDAYGMSTAYNSTDGNNPTSGTGNPYSYNGEYTDPDTGFQYLRSRYYNSQTGSFLTEDSYSGSILEPLSQNRYIYTGNNPVNLADPGGHAWISGTAAKVAAAAKKTTSKPGAVKSGAATAVKNATKKAVTSTKNTVSTSGQKSKGSSKQNLSKGVKTASTKQQKIVTTSSKSSGSSSAKKSWENAVSGSITGIAASVVRRLTPGLAYMNNQLLTVSSEKERKLCSGGGRLPKGSAAAGVGVIKGINQAITNIWNRSMSVNPIGKIFLKQENGVFPGIGSTVMEIAQRVIKEQETQVKNNGEKNLWTELSSGVATYFDQNHITEEQMEVINKNIEDVFGGRKVYIPDTVTKVVNGVTSEVHPNIDWWMIGNGRYPIGVQKEDEKYKIAVGPKIIDPEYPDDGKIQDDDFDGYSKNVKLILEHKVTGEEKIIECTVVDFKAHSYNTYPDGQPYNTGDIVSFDVENGLIQTGIAYPESSNAKKPGAFTKESSDGNIIEFAGHALDFDPNEYVLCHLIVVQ